MRRGLPTSRSVRRWIGHPEGVEEHAVEPSQRSGGRALAGVVADWTTPTADERPRAARNRVSHDEVELLLLFPATRKAQ